MFRMEGSQLEHGVWEWLCWNGRPKSKEDTKRVRFEGHSSWRLTCPRGCVRPIHDERAPREGRRVQISVPKPGADPCVQTGGSVFRSREEQGRYPEWLPALEISMHL